MKKIKMIAMDLDGTLLRNDTTIDAMTLDRLEKARKQGIILVLATGRDKGALDFVSDQLHLEEGNHYIAGVNGQIVYSFLKQEYLCDELLTANDVKNVLEVSKSLGCEAIVCNGYQHYAWTPPFMKLYKRFAKLLFAKPMDYGLAQGQRTFTQIQDIHQDFGPYANKCILLQSKSFFKKNLPYIKQALGNCNVLEIGPMWIEVMPKGVNKGKALLKIAEENQISKDEVLCFGDAENDLSMMEIFPYSIAMGNAMECVKKVAYAVCESNMDSGIAKTLDRYIFHKE